VVVTGASTGIGRACAQMLAKSGFETFAGVRKESDAQSVRDDGIDRLQPVTIDVGDPESITAAKAYVLDRTGGVLAGLVNNAGIVVAGPLELLPLEELRWQLEINVIGQLAVSQAFLPALRAGQGRIAMMSSVGGKITTPYMGPYCASKYALEALSDSLRRELRPWNIHVGIIEPGVVKTPIWNKGKDTLAVWRERLAKAPEAAALYADRLENMSDKVGQADKAGVPPEAVGKAVVHCLTARRPKVRYPVGLDAKVGVRIAAFVPDRIIDWAAGRLIK
jgi:NAD(P)-dependent dehydrogenase (short-subunit alcohol dehydrogenase family)